MPKIYRGLKVGKMKLPDVLYTEKGEPVRMIDMVSEMRSEFREISYLLTFSNLLATTCAAKASAVMRKKHRQFWVHPKSLSFFSILWTHYSLTGEKILSTHHLQQYVGQFNMWWFYNRMDQYMPCGYYDRIARGKIMLTDAGINAMNIYLKEYQQALEWHKNKLAEMEGIHGVQRD